MAQNQVLQIDITANNSNLKKSLQESMAELKRFKKEVEGSYGGGMTKGIEKEVIANQKLIQSINQVKLETATLTLEKKKTTGATQAASGSYREAQQRLTALGKSIREASGGFDGSNKAIENQIKEYNELNAKLKAFDATMGNHQRQVGNYALSQGSANGVAMEFNRIIQDAPFGMMGIGNNIQQLTANWAVYTQQAKAAAAANNTTVSTGALLRGALSSIVSPANLLTLGIAALTSGWILYEKWQQKANKTTKESKDKMQELAESLNTVSSTFFEAAKSSGQESAQLKTLYSISTDVTKATNERKNASDRLIKQYPELLGKFTAEQVMLGQAQTAYNNLSQSILATARAQAAYGKIGEKAGLQIAIDESNRALQKEISLIDIRIQKQESLVKSTGKATTATGEAVELGNVSKVNDLYEERRGMIKQQTDNLLQRATLQEQINDLEGVALTNQVAINDAYGMGTDGLKATNKELDALKNKLKDVIQELKESDRGFKLNDWEVKLANISDKYKEISNIIQKGLNAKLITSAEKTRLDLLVEQTKELEKQRVLVDRFIDNDKGIKSENRVTLTGSLSALPTSTGLINSAAGQRAANRPVAQIDDEFSKYIKSTLRRSVSQSLNGIIDDLTSLGQNTYDIEKKYNDMRQDATADQIQALNKMEKLEKKVNNGFTNMLQNAVKSLSSIGSNMLTSAIGTDVSNGNWNEITKMFTGNNKMMGYGALGSMAGGIIQGSTSKKSYAGQIGGGMLAGAGMGAMMGSVVPVIGTAIGAAVGAVVGGLSGWLGASKANKQYELEQLQLAEQRKQTALQERLTALSYQSSIIGQMSNQGIINSFDRDAFGNIVATIAGKDIVLAIDRTKAGN